MSLPNATCNDCKTQKSAKELIVVFVRTFYKLLTAAEYQYLRLFSHSDLWNYVKKDKHPFATAAANMDIPTQTPNIKRAVPMFIFRKLMKQLQTSLLSDNVADGVAFIKSQEMSPDTLLKLQKNMLGFIKLFQPELTIAARDGFNTIAKVTETQQNRPHKFSEKNNVITVEENYNSTTFVFGPMQKNVNLSDDDALISKARQFSDNNLVIIVNRNAAGYGINFNSDHKNEPIIIEDTIWSLPGVPLHKTRSILEDLITMLNEDPDSGLDEQTPSPVELPPNTRVKTQKETLIEYWRTITSERGTDAKIKINEYLKEPIGYYDIGKAFAIYMFNNTASNKNIKNCHNVVKRLYLNMHYRTDIIEPYSEIKRVFEEYGHAVDFSTKPNPKLPLQYQLFESINFAQADAINAFINKQPPSAWRDDEYKGVRQEFEDLVLGYYNKLRNNKQNPLKINLLNITPHMKIYVKKLQKKYDKFIASRTDLRAKISDAYTDVESILAERFEVCARGAIFPAPPNFINDCLPSYCDLTMTSCFGKATPKRVIPSHAQRFREKALDPNTKIFIIGAIDFDKGNAEHYVNPYPLRNPNADHTEIKQTLPQSIQGKEDWQAAVREYNTGHFISVLDTVQRFVTLGQTSTVCPILNPPGSVMQGGGVVYPARIGELSRWAAIITVASGVAALVARQARRRGVDMQRSIIMHGTAYALTVVLLATVMILDPEACGSGFEATRVALHVASIALTTGVAVTHARLRGAGDSAPWPSFSIDGYAAALYAAALVAAAAI